MGGPGWHRDTWLWTRAGRPDFLAVQEKEKEVDDEDGGGRGRGGERKRRKEKKIHAMMHSVLLYLQGSLALPGSNFQ